MDTGNQSARPYHTLIKLIKMGVGALQTFRLPILCGLSHITTADHKTHKANTESLPRTYKSFHVHVCVYHLSPKYIFTCLSYQLSFLKSTKSAR